MKISCGIVLVAASVLVACSAEISVSELDPGAEAGTIVNGVPFRVKDRYVLDVYQKSDNGYNKIAEQVETLPNPNRLYILHHTGQLLANTDTKFILQPDGTLDNVHLGAESQADEALTSLGEQVAATGKAVDEIRQGREAERSADETALQAEEGAEVDYLTAIKAAKQAEAELAELSANTLPSAKVAKENEVIVLKFKANIAARRAGLPRPFEDVTL